jgi:hypothetical protein
MFHHTKVPIKSQLLRVNTLLWQTNPCIWEQIEQLDFK